MSFITYPDKLDANTREVYSLGCFLALCDIIDDFNVVSCDEYEEIVATKDGRDGAIRFYLFYDDEAEDTGLAWSIYKTLDDCINHPDRSVHDDFGAIPWGLNAIAEWANSGSIVEWQRCC